MILIPGIGPRTAERLRDYGVETLGRLQRCTIAGLVERFGEHHGCALSDRAHFRDTSPVARRALKSRSVETTFDRDVADHGTLERIVPEQAERLAADLADRGLRGRTIGIKVRLDDWTTVTRVHTVEAPTNDSAAIAATARRLLRKYAPPRPVRLLGVRVAAFGEPERRPAHGSPEALSLLAS